MPNLKKLFKKNPTRICPKSGKLKTINFSGKISKLFYPIFSLLALFWIIFRVVTKPSRINYPCVKAAFPIASGLVFYVISLIVSTLSILKAKKVYKEGRYLAAVVFAAVGIFAGIHIYSIDERPVIANTIQLDVPNMPIGSGKGIFPGV